jgi:hypothetical protein
MKAVCLVWLVVLVAFGPTLAMADEVQDGSTADPNPSGDIVAGTDGTSNHTLKMDPLGIIRITEEYPPMYQIQRQALASNFRVAGAEANPTVYLLGNAVAAYPWGRGVIHVARDVPAGDTGDVGVTLFLYGSWDEQSYQPVSTGWGTSTGATVDTSQIYIPGGVTGVRISYDMFPGKFLAVWGFADSTGAANDAFIDIWHEGRMF